MPRSPRIELPGIPLHVTQRGVNHAAIFVDEDDRRLFLGLLQRCRREHAVALHAWVLMGNHVHLLMSTADPGGIGRAMRALGQQYVQAFNRRHDRSGGLWQGRFKSCPVDDDRYLLRVARYIELNPVRAGIVARAWDWPWSSARRHLGMHGVAAHDPHPGFQALGGDGEARAAAWRAVLATSIDPAETQAIRTHIAKERALGEPRFMRMLESALGRVVHPRPRGRPRTG